MASVDFGGSRSKRPDVTRTTGDAPQRARSARAALEIGGTFMVLMLIAISALAVRFLLYLPNGLMN